MSHVTAYPTGSTYASEGAFLGPTVAWADNLRPLETLNRGFDTVDDFSFDLAQIEARAERVRTEEVT